MVHCCLRGVYLNEVRRCRALAKLTGATGDALEFPTQRRAEAEVVLVRSYGWFAVEVFIHVETPVQVLDDFYLHI